MASCTATEIRCAANAIHVRADEVVSSYSEAEPDATKTGALFHGKAANAVSAQLPGSRPIARAQGGIDGAGATAAAKAGWTGVLYGEQTSGSQEEEDRNR
jgi:hypothetical protein